MAEINTGGEGMFLGELPADNLNSTLGNYDPQRNTYPEEGVYAQSLARALAEEVGKPAGLLLTGEPGNGKTHLAVGIGRAIAEQGGRAAFITFRGGGIDYSGIPQPQGSIGWHYAVDTLVSTHDVLIFDDVPGDLPPGSRLDLQKITVSSYTQAKRIVMTSNRPAPEVIEQLARPGSTEYGSSDISIAVRERIRQAWNLVDFRGESFRSGQPKWYSEIVRPENMPTIEQAVREADAVKTRRDEDTLLHGIARVVKSLGNAAGVPQGLLQDLQQALDRTPRD